jgi:hypothetical protein
MTRPEQPEQPKPTKPHRARKQSLHEEVGRLAVPSFDWIAEPVNGFADALVALSPPHWHVRRPRERHDTHEQHGHAPDQPA